jgi:aminopeptidase N
MKHFLFVLFIGVSAVSAFAQSPVIPPHWIRSHDYDVQHYRIQVSFDWQKKSVSGETTITFRPFLDNLREIEVDAGSMNIQSVKLAGGTPLEHKYDGREKLNIKLDRAYPAGRDVSITIAYTATPARGLIFITPNEDDPRRPYQIYSLGAAETNHYWFPCYDSPNDRATSETIVRVDDKYSVISNGALLEVKKDAARHQATYHWKMDQPFSSYLVSIIVGEFAEIKEEYAGIPVITYVPKDKVGEARLSLGKIDDMVKFFSEKTGVRYPYPKYAQTTVRDLAFGMENISATTLGEFGILSQRAMLDRTSEELISHELAHQWFGDYVTCRDWSETWLNEGFATYFAHLYSEHDKGRDEMLYELLADQRQYLAAWAFGRPPRQPIVNNRYDDPDSAFGVYTYPRAGASLHMLRSVLGDDGWWKSIHHYLTTNALRNVETTQLKIAIEEATGQSLGWFFDEWFWKMGHPEFEVSYNFDPAAKTLKMKVRQTQRPPDKSVYQTPDVFRMPVDIGITTTAGERVERVWIEKRDQDFTFVVDSKPLIVNFDRGNTIIKRLKFEKTKDELLYQARHDADVMGRIWAVNELKSKNDDETVSVLGEILAVDKFWGVRVEAARALGGFKTDASRVALQGGWNDPKSAVRREVIRALSQFKDPALADSFIKTIEGDQSYGAVAEASIALANTGSPKAFDVLSKTAEASGDQNAILIAALNGLSWLGDARGYEIARKYAVAPNPPDVRGPALTAAVRLGKSDPARRDELVVMLAAAMKGSGQMVVMAMRASAELGDSRTIPAIRFAISNPVMTVVWFGRPSFREMGENIIKELEARQTAKP